jgi:hypothetical protein
VAIKSRFLSSGTAMGYWPGVQSSKVKTTAAFLSLSHLQMVPICENVTWHAKRPMPIIEKIDIFIFLSVNVKPMQY